MLFDDPLRDEEEEKRRQALMQLLGQPLTPPTDGTQAVAKMQQAMGVALPPMFENTPSTPSAVLPSTQGSPLQSFASPSGPMPSIFETIRARMPQVYPGLSTPSRASALAEYKPLMEEETPLSPLSQGSDWREDNGVRINDGFDVMGNLLGTSSPIRGGGMAALPGAGYTTQGYNGLISPISHPGDNTAGVMQLMRANDDAAYQGPALFRHGLATQLKQMEIDGELNKAKMLAGNKHDAQFNKSLTFTGDPRVPTPQAIEGINQMEINKEITPDAARNMKLQRLTSRLSPDGKSFVPLYDTKTGSMQDLAGALSSGELANYPPEVVKKFLEENLGITRDKVVKRHSELLKAGIPFKTIRGTTVDNPDLFSRNNLSPEQQTEFDVINRIFGRKK